MPAAVHTGTDTAPVGARLTTLAAAISIDGAFSATSAAWTSSCCATNAWTPPTICRPRTSSPPTSSRISKHALEQFAAIQTDLSLARLGSDDLEDAGQP